jgi:hypothetical protein
MVAEDIESFNNSCLIFWYRIILASGDVLPIDERPISSGELISHITSDYERLHHREFSKISCTLAAMYVNRLLPWMRRFFGVSSEWNGETLVEDDEKIELIASNDNNSKEIPETGSASQSQNATAEITFNTHQELSNSDLERNLRSAASYNSEDDVITVPSESSAQIDEQNRRRSDSSSINDVLDKSVDGISLEPKAPEKATLSEQSSKHSTPEKKLPKVEIKVSPQSNLVDKSLGIKEEVTPEEAKELDGFDEDVEDGPAEDDDDDLVFQASDDSKFRPRKGSLDLEINYDSDEDAKAVLNQMSSSFQQKETPSKAALSRPRSRSTEEKKTKEKKIVSPASSPTTASESKIKIAPDVQQFLLSMDSAREIDDEKNPVTTTKSNSSVGSAVSQPSLKNLMSGPGTGRKAKLLAEVRGDSVYKESLRQLSAVNTQRSRGSSISDTDHDQVVLSESEGDVWFSNHSDDQVEAEFNTNEDPLESEFEGTIRANMFISMRRFRSVFHGVDVSSLLGDSIKDITFGKKGRHAGVVSHHVYHQSLFESPSPDEEKKVDFVLKRDYYDSLLSKVQIVSGKNTEILLIMENLSALYDLAQEISNDLPKPFSFVENSLCSTLALLSMLYNEDFKQHFCLAFKMFQESPSGLEWHQLHMFLCSIISSYVCFGRFPQLLLPTKAKIICRSARIWGWKIYSHFKVKPDTISVDELWNILHRIGEVLTIDNVPQLGSTSWAMISKAFMRVVEDHLRLRLRVFAHSDSYKDFLSHSHFTESLERMRYIQDSFYNGSLHMSIDLVVLIRQFVEGRAASGQRFNRKISRKEIIALLNSVTGDMMGGRKEFITCVSKVTEIMHHGANGLIDIEHLCIIILVLVYGSVNPIRLVNVMFALLDRNADSLLDRQDVFQYFSCLSALMLYFFTFGGVDELKIRKKIAHDFASQATRFVFKKQHWDTIAVEELVIFHRSNPWFGCLDFRNARGAELEFQKTMRIPDLIWNTVLLDIEFHIDKDVQKEMVKLRQRISLRKHTLAEFIPFAYYVTMDYSMDVKDYEAEVEENGIVKKKSEKKGFSTRTNLNDFKRFLNLTAVSIPLHSFYIEEEMHHQYFKTLYNELEFMLGSKSDDESNVLTFRNILAAIAWLLGGSFEQKLSNLLLFYDSNADGVITRAEGLELFQSVLCSISAFRWLRASFNSKKQQQWRVIIRKAADLAIGTIFDTLHEMHLDDCFQQILDHLGTPELSWIKVISFLEFERMDVLSRPTLPNFAQLDRTIDFSHLKVLTAHVLGKGHEINQMYHIVQQKKSNFQKITLESAQILIASHFPESFQNHLQLVFAIYSCGLEAQDVKQYISYVDLASGCCMFIPDLPFESRFHLASLLISLWNPKASPNGRFISRVSLSRILLNSVAVITGFAVDECSLAARVIQLLRSDLEAMISENLDLLLNENPVEQKESHSDQLLDIDEFIDAVESTHLPLFKIFHEFSPTDTSKEGALWSNLLNNYEEFGKLEAVIVPFIEQNSDLSSAVLMTVDALQSLTLGFFVWLQSINSSSIQPKILIEHLFQSGPHARFVEGIRSIARKHLIQTVDIGVASFNVRFLFIIVLIENSSAEARTPKEHFLKDSD